MSSSPASLLVIGAGPAGLLAAWAAARRRPPHGVRVLERMPMPGVKLAVTGGGRGNLSHLATEEEFATAFGPHGRFTIPAFRALPPDRLCALLGEAGIATETDEQGRIYPRSHSAAEVRDQLLRTCRKSGVEFEYRHAVERLAPPESPAGPWTIDGCSAHAVVLAAGGQSFPRLGSDGSGFGLARALGYEVVAPVPALSALQTDATWPARHSGLTLPDVSVSIVNRGGLATRGELLFTHRGISGPAVLNLSGAVARRLHAGEPVTVLLELVPEAPDLRALRQSAGGRSILPWLATHVPRTLAVTILELAGIPESLTFSRLTAAQEQALIQNLTALPLSIRGTGGFQDSMATAGGIRLKQVDPRTLEGRLTRRLYFAGEILDLDGPTGGWNLQWAFCSGHLAGTMACLDGTGAASGS